MKRHLLKSLRLTIITAAVSLLSVGQPILLKTFTASTAAILLYASKAQAKDASEIADIAKAITVRIEGATQGSGVLINKEGNRYTVLTAWHVLQDNLSGEEVAIITSDGKEYLWESKSLQRLGKVDMAVITFTSKKKYQVATIGDSKEVNYQDQVYVAGFPFFDFRNLKVESGEVVANADISIDQGYQLLYSNQTEKGMSGGVILNKNGELIGLHGRGEIDRKKKKEEEIISKTGINQGVPISFYKQFLNGLPVLVSKKNLTTADDYLAQAKASQDKQGREQTILRLVNQAIKIRANNSPAFFLRAYTKYNLDDHEGAIIDYTTNISMDSDNKVSYFNRGISKKRLGNYKDAIDDYKIATQIDPLYKNAYYAIGLSKTELGKCLEAITAYDKAIKIDPNFSNAFYARGICKDRLGNYKDAIDDYKIATKINPLYKNAYYAIGVSKEKSEKCIEGITAYDKAIKIDPNFTNAFYARGICNGKLGKFRKAIKDLKKAVSIDKNKINADIYYSIGYYFAELGKHQKAIIAYTQAININPKYTDAYIGRAISRQNSKNLKSACNDYEKVISMGDKEIQKWFLSKKGKWCRNMPD